ncbi:MAG: nucleotidyltransferase domain-containing protein [Cyanobacteria bacterium P01_H01_bin.74]
MSKHRYNPKIKPSAIDALVKQISLFPDVDKIILFGSRARGDNDFYSDIDIAVEGDFKAQEWQKIKRLADVEDATIKTLLKIDLVNMNTATNALKESILQEGQILYERN